MKVIIKLGIDFGSTYSTFAKYDRLLKRPVPMKLQNDTSNIPSIISHLEGDTAIDFGVTAKDNIGDSDYVIQDAFKMLLTETNKELLERRGYTATQGPGSPRYAARQFLTAALEACKSGNPDAEFGEVYICHPECWNSDSNAMDRRIALRDILQEISEDKTNNITINPEGIHLVSEPEAASAYFAHSLIAATGKPFNGHLLLIDYGGGTLDLALTEVKTLADGTSLSIKYCHGDGEGENHVSGGTTTVGRAGISYMQGIIIKVMRENGLLGSDQDPDYADPNFAKIVKKLESTLCDSATSISEHFEEHSRKLSFFETDETQVVKLRYMRKDLIVTYRHLYTAYKELIQPVLTEVLERFSLIVQDEIKMDPKKPEAGRKGNFKIALVGGFGTYWLVQNQVNKFFNRVLRDTRFEHIELDEEEADGAEAMSRENRQKAIALGAALLAEGAVQIKHVARYSLGLMLSKAGQNAKPETYWVIRTGQEIEPGEIRYVSENGSNFPLVRPHEVLSYFCLRDRDAKFYSKCKLRDDFIQLLTKIHEERQDIFAWNIGFSLDANEFLTVSLSADPLLHPNADCKPIQRLLDSPKNLGDHRYLIERIKL